MKNYEWIPKIRTVFLDGTIRINAENYTEDQNSFNEIFYNLPSSIMILLVRAAASTGALVCKMRFEVVIQQTAHEDKSVALLLASQFVNTKRYMQSVNLSIGTNREESVSEVESDKVYM